MLDEKINTIIINKNLKNEDKCSLILQLIKNNNELTEDEITIFENDLIFYKDFFINLIKDEKILNEYKTNILCSFLADELNLNEKNVFSKEYYWTNIEEHI